jgi:hypothetical protein
MVNYTNQKTTRASERKSEMLDTYRYQWGLVGSLIIAVGAAMLRLAIELLYKSDETSRLLMGWATLAAGIILTVHGLIYACLGVSGWRDLYIF